MSDLVQKLTEEALLLPSEIRAELVEKLLESLNVPTQKEIARLWAEESERRVKEYEEGKVEGIDGEKLFKEIRTQLEK